MTSYPALTSSALKLPSRAIVACSTPKPASVHAFWSARVPYIPTFLSGDFTHLLGGGERSRIGLIVARQVRFLNDLSTTDIPGATFDLRLSFSPDTDRVEVAFVGKAGGDTEPEANTQAKRAWEKFQAHFPSEAPFGYPLQPVMKEEEVQSIRYPTWLREGQVSLVEIRKFVDINPMSDFHTLQWGTYPHPFVPAFDFGALGKFMEVLVQQQIPTVVSICIRPMVLEDEDVAQMQGEVSKYEAQVFEWQMEKSDYWRTVYETQRLKAMQEAVVPYLERGKLLFMFKVQVVSSGEEPALALADALGSELTDNTSTARPRLWEPAVPKDEELSIALSNFAHLEFSPWRLNDDLELLPMLCTGREAAGVFRLPIPPESGYMPGLLVQDEPFESPQGSEAKGQKKRETYVRAGKILHRGLPSGIPFVVTPDILKRHTLIAGSTGSGKTNTALLLLSRLWTEQRIPFLVLYPVDKPDYRKLWLDEKNLAPHLLYFTVGDSTASPLRFNPFAVPEGVLLRTHISRLLQVFTTAYQVPDPIPLVYREALRETYRRKGWNLETGKGGEEESPTLDEFYLAMTDVADSLTRGYSARVQADVRQASQIRIRDLVLNASSTLGAREALPWDAMLYHPTALELARLGSEEDIALVMGMLLISLVGELTTRKQRGIRTPSLPPDLSPDQVLEACRKSRVVPPLHLTLIEEAHRLMPRSVNVLDPRSALTQQGAAMFDRLLAEVRGLNEGLLIAEQIPVRLVGGAMGNTHLKIMHWLEDAESFSLFSRLLSLTERQETRARLLREGEALTRGPQGRPMHVKIDFFDVPDGQVVPSDSNIREFMKQRGFSFQIDQNYPFDQACIYCRVPCLWSEPVKRAKWLDTVSRTTEFVQSLARYRNKPGMEQLEAIKKHALKWAGQLGKQDENLAYCILARMASNQGFKLRWDKDGEKHRVPVGQFLQPVLKHFHMKGAK
jgi:hypothetical protein